MHSRGLEIKIFLLAEGHRGVGPNVPRKFLEKKRRASYRWRAGKPTHCLRIPLSGQYVFCLLLCDQYCIYSDRYTNGIYTVLVA